MKIRAILLACATIIQLSMLQAMHEGISMPLVPPYTKAITITTQDKKTFTVSADLMSQSKKFSSSLKKEKEIFLPRTSSKHLALLLSLAESPLTQIDQKISVKELIEALKAEVSLDLNKKLVKEPLFKAIAERLTWDEKSLGQVVLEPDSVLPKPYKESIIRAFAQDPAKLKEITAGAERPWNIDDVEEIILSESLPNEAILLILKELIESRPGLLEALVGFDNVHDYRCRTNPEMAEACTFSLFAQQSTDEDRQLLTDLRARFQNKYKTVQSQLLAKYR